MIKNIILSISILVISFLGLSAQYSRPDSILEKIKESYLKIIDYQADMEIKVNVNFIEIPDKKAKIYVKQPDKIKYQSDDFILLPKKGFEFSINEILKYKYTSIYIKTDTIQNLEYEVIKIIPHELKSEIILATLWINKENSSIFQMEINTKKAGDFIMGFTYKESNVLPQQVIISFDLKEINIPFSFLSGENKDLFNNKDKIENSKGEIIISYSNYIINSGIPDSLFKK